MTKLVIRLSGRAEEQFNELLDKTQADKKDVILDALALLHYVIYEVAKGKKIAIFDPKTKEASPFTLPSLNLTRMDIHIELQNVLSSYLTNKPEAARELAREFQVATFTVRRWLSGMAHPHPRLAQMIIDYVKTKTD